MFPYKSAVGLFIIQILKALALIKAVAIYPVSCYIKVDPERFPSGLAALASWIHEVINAPSNVPCATAL